MSAEFERLEPAGAPVAAGEAVRGVRLGELAPAERPYLVINMVATADGRATIDGRAGPIGAVADRELFHRLRTLADAVMVGARTAAVERYGRLVRDPDLREQRRRQGLAPDPLAVLVSGRLSLRSDLPLLQDEASRVLVLTAAGGEVEGVRAQVQYVRGEEELDLAAALRRLRVEMGVRSVLCEGGPGLNAALLRAGLVDELFLTLAPKLAGGDPLAIVAGPGLVDVVDMDLVWALRSGSELFLRYRLHRR